MASLNLSANGPSISASYQKIVNAPPPSGGAASSSTYGQWAVFSVQAPLVSAFQQESGKESVLKVQTTGEGELLDLIEEFSDGRIQFAFVKVKDPNTTLPKSVLVAWCGEGVPERTKGYFTSHLNAVSKVLHGYHVQITARSDRDLTPELIVQKVADASGSKYSGGGTMPASSGPPPPVASKPVLPTKSFGASSGFQPLGGRSRAPQASAPVDADGWGDDAPPVTRSQLEKVQSAYQPTKVNMAQLQSQHVPSQYQASQQQSSNPDVVKGGYQPIGKVDLNAIRREAQEQGRVQDDRPTMIKGAYEPVGKVDIAAIRQQARAAPPSAAQAPPPPEASVGEDERPKSLADRSAAFTSAGAGERLTSLPKPAVGNRFGSQASAFGGTRAPQPGGFEAKPMAPSAAPVGTASKTFADEGGKTPAQIWAEKKARQRGSSSAADTQPASFGTSTSPVQPQTSGGWQSSYPGRKWDVNIPSRTGGSGVSAQRTGEEPVRESDPEPAAGGVSSIRDRFADAPPMGAPGAGSAPEPPPLDTSNKPNAGARGVPIPGLPTRPHQQDIPAEEHQDLPPPPPRPIPQDEPEEEYVSQESPPLIPRLVPRGPEPDLEKSEPLPPRPVPTESLQQTTSRHQDPDPEPQAQDETFSRGAAQAAAAASLGAVAGGAAAASSLPSTTAQEQGGRSAVAQYDYEKAEENELELRDGDQITNIDMVDEDWWMGQNPRGETGLFPANYVELIPEGQESAGNVGGLMTPPPEPEPAPAAPAAPMPAAGGAGGGQTATAQYDYEAGEDNELSFPDGATVTDIVSLP